MARRADHSREELAEMAVNAGVKLISKEGFKGFSGRKVATAIGYTVGTLYNVFGNYDTMILRINARTLDEWFAYIQSALKKAGKGSDLHVLAKAYISFSRNHYQQWLALFEYHLDDKTEIPDWYREKLNRFFEATESALLPKLGGDKRKAKKTAHVLWAGIHGICVLSLSGKLDLVAADAAETLATSFIDNYMRGLTHG